MATRPRRKRALTLSCSPRRSAAFTHSQSSSGLGPRVRLWGASRPPRWFDTTSFALIAVPHFHARARTRRYEVYYRVCHEAVVVKYGYPKSAAASGGVAQHKNLTVTCAGEKLFSRAPHDIADDVSEVRTVMMWHIRESPLLTTKMRPSYAAPTSPSARIYTRGLALTRRKRAR